MNASEPAILHGSGPLLPGDGRTADVPAQIRLEEAGFSLQLGAETRMAAHRDVETIAVQQGTVLLVLGAGEGTERVLLEGFGEQRGQVVRELRDRRFRQRMGDAFIQPPDTAIPLVEYAAGPDTGVAQLAYHPWGAVLAPLDEHRPWITLRRRSIGEVRQVPEQGAVTIEVEPQAARPASAGGSGKAGGGGNAVAGGSVQLLGLGSFARTHSDAMTGLRDAAHADSGRLIGGLIPDAEYGAQQLAARLLVDGRPADPSQLGDAWPD
ncbi:MAG TPA: hypothetical protein VNF73_02065, partial [Candidatus Saccharimonadales bacterium]|nr:hypothetical protein [Candidatus Saccharimonadales bacterium]